MLKEDAGAPATVIIERLRRDGYDGGITILKEYLRKVRPLFVEAESRQRTSYLPGELGHTDWWDTRVWVPVGKGATREVFGLVITLPYSAAHAAVFSFSKRMADFLPAFSGTLQRLDGVSSTISTPTPETQPSPKPRDEQEPSPTSGTAATRERQPVSPTTWPLSPPISGSPPNTANGSDTPISSNAPSEKHGEESR